jgi:hypothetical protein
MFGLAVLCTLLAVWSPRLGHPKSAFKPISGVVSRFEKQRNTRGRFREFVVIETEEGPLYLSVSGYFAKEMRLLKEGDQVQALVLDDFAAELESSGRGSFTFDDYARIKDDDTRWGQIVTIIGAVVFWLGFVFAVIDQRMSRLVRKLER